MKYGGDEKTAGANRMSPSPRRAWIEIQLQCKAVKKLFGRPPHGGRGLKYFPARGIDKKAASSSTLRVQSETSVYIEPFTSLEIAFLLFYDNGFGI